MARSRITRPLAAAAIALATLAGAVPSIAQTPMDTHFTYQGRLTNSGSPATGNYDFECKLFLDAAGTTQTGPTVTLTNIAVTNGLFTLAPDFGAQFTGFKNFLSVGVRPTGGGSFTPVGPLQEIAAAPVSLFSMAPFAPVSGTYDISYKFGNVGIGRDPGSIVGIPFGLDVDTKLIRLGTASNGGGSLVIGNNPGDNKIYLEMYNSTNNGSAAESLLTGFGGANMPKLTLAADTVGITGNLGLGISSPTARVDARASGTGTGVYGYTNTGVGLYGYCTSTTAGTAVYADGAQYGVYARSYANTGAAVYASNDSGNALIAVNNASGYASLAGQSNNAGGFGGYFYNSAGGVALWVNGVTQTKALQILGGADVAEPFDIAPAASAPEQMIEAGMVVSIDPEHAGELRLCDSAYDTKVAGVISGANGLAPGMILRSEGDANADGKHPVAMTGRVWVWCDAAAGGAVHPGDRLTTSATPGHAMRVDEDRRTNGAVIGKAMTELKEGRGLVLVLVNLQ